MGLFDFLPSRTSLELPPPFTPHKGESPELQMESLLYLFKRLRINRLSSFSQGNTLKYSDNKEESIQDSAQEPEVSRWDKIYQTTEMKRRLLGQKERVLIDWLKNKFRSLCILQREPGPSLRNKDYELEDGFPVFKDYKDRKTGSFVFFVIPIDQQLNFTELAFELAQSTLYVEHHSYVSVAARIQCAKEAISKCLGQKFTSESVVILSEETHTQVISAYVSSLAFIVQLFRIYDLHIKHNSDSKVSAKPSLSLKSSFSFASKESPSKPQSRSNSPVKARGSYAVYESLNDTPSSPTKTLGSKKSLANLRNTRLENKPSISNLRANEIYNPVAAPVSPERRSSPGRMQALDHSSLYGREVQPELWEKCKQSINEKLRIEAQVIG